MIWLLVLHSLVLVVVLIQAQSQAQKDLVGIHLLLSIVVNG